MESTPAQRTSLFRSSAMQQILALAALILMLIVFTIASELKESAKGGHQLFLTGNNMIGILIATAVNGVLALGVTFVIITGGIDLSIGTVMTLAAVTTGVFVTNLGLPVGIGVILGVLTGGLCGLINGTVIAKLKLPPFIATLGMLNIAKGIALVLTLKPIYFTDTPVFNQIAMGSILGSLIPGFEIPNAVLIMFGFAIIASLVLTKTILGRYTFALGSNEEATRLSGVNVDRWKIAVYTVTGLFSGLAGVLIASRLNSAQPSLGQGYELDAIAAAVIGGTSLSGGEGTMSGTIIGAFVISTLTNGLLILSVPQEWRTVVTGGIIILAVYVDIIRRRRK